jgi:hypothetical protein
MPASWRSRQKSFRVGEVRASRRRDAARVDAAEDRLQPRREDVRDVTDSAGAAHCGPPGRSAGAGAGRAVASARAECACGAGCRSSIAPSCCLTLPTAEPPFEQAPDLLARERRDRRRPRLEHLDAAGAAVAALVALGLGHRLSPPAHVGKPRSSPGRHRERAADRAGGRSCARRTPRRARALPRRAPRRSGGPRRRERSGAP